jgi:RimJ/RimL family protein N-acetyltransferase
MQIVEYMQTKWSAPVKDLLSAIYPDWLPAQWERMCYDEGLPLHLQTLLALYDETPIGQINIFRVAENARLGNVGYHVHPDWQRRGIGSLLLCSAWSTIASAFEDGLVIQTRKSNAASVALATKAGFSPIAPELVAKYSASLKFAAAVDGVCLHHRSTRKAPTNELKQSAERAAVLP